MLSQFLVSQLFAFMLIFCRVGTAIMLLPGFGESYVSPRFRLMLAVMFAILLTPVISNIPPVPGNVAPLVTLVIAEIMTGLFMGGLARILISALHIAGTILALQSSLASALVQDVTQIQGQASPLSNFLGMTAIVLMFATGLHYVMLQGLVDSYNLFIPGNFPIVEDFANHATRTMNGAFIAALQISAPNIVVGFILYLGSGIIARLVPNIQVFFLIMSPQIMISFFVMLIAFSSMMLWYMDYFRESLNAFLEPG